MPRRWLFLSAASVLVVVSLVVVLLQGRGADAGTPSDAGSSAVVAAGTSPAARDPETPPTAASRTPSPTAPSAKEPEPPRTPTESPEPKSPTEPATAPDGPSSAKAPRAASGTAPLAGRIAPGTTYSGVATFYDTDGSGACLYDAGDDVLTGAMNTTDYEASMACGAYVRVESGGKSVTVRITNECPGACAPGQIDLSAQAFALLAAPSAGRIPITWALVSPSDPGTMSVRYKTGSTRYWCGIQVIGHRNPLARLEVRSGDGWRRLPRASYNYFLAEDGGGCGAAIRLTDIYGEQLTVGNVAVRPDATQPTGVQFARH